MQRIFINSSDIRITRLQVYIVTEMATAIPNPIQMVLPKSSFDKLKCYLCQRLLSVPPICLDMDKYTCGRCKTNGKRVTIYEELAKSMIFPCTFKGCEEETPWSQVQKHELICAHRTILCPVVSCKATSLEIGSIPKHFEDFHPVAIYSEEITILRRMRDLPLNKFNKDRKVFLLNNNNVPYLVMAYLDCNLGPNDDIKGYQLSFGVYSLKRDTLTYQVDLIVKHPQQELLYRWEYQEIKLFNDSCHCFYCFGGNCMITGHKNDKTNFLTSQLSNIPKVFPTTITYTIKINQCLPLNGTEIDKLLCSSCRDIMHPPIYVCGCGQSQCCSNCKRRLMKCSKCAETFGQHRNIILEKFAENVSIPCQNVARGCTYTGLVKSTKQHGINCKYNFL